MVESDDEFTELCTKLLKRVKKKSKPSEGQSALTASTTGKSKLKKPKPSKAKSKTSNGVSKEVEQNIKAGDRPEKPSNEAEGGSIEQSRLSNGQTEKDCSGRESQEEPAGQKYQPSVKHLVLERLQQYKRASPVRIKLNSLEANEEQVEAYMMDADIHADRDLAMALQMDLKKPSTGLEDEGLFFCQLCQKDLTAMSSVLREQHVNRCLDQSESSEGNSAASAVPSCPLCGKPFTTEKARASHLKRCAAKLEVPAQTLLQAVQRQAAETGTEVPTGMAQVKRKGVPKKKEPSKKRKIAKTGAEIEDLMVAMALSRSLQEENPLPNPECAQPARQFGPAEKKSRSKKKKDKPPPVLLVQAPEEAVQKLQKRLSLLLSEEPVDNNQITLPASSFWNIEEADRETWRMHAGKNCVLWDISNMMEKRNTVSYYTPELNPPITPWKPLSKKVHSSQPRAVTPTTPNLPARVPGSQKHRDQCASPATPLKDQKPLSDSQKDRQALLDLAELAGEGMTLTQWNYAASRTSNQTGRESPVSIECSGFIPLKEDVTRKESRFPDTNKNAIMTLMADFMEMVNNPHLSDAQLQTDCGEVLYVHMFVLYARCPLLVEAIHSEGFYVDEGSTGRVKRFLLNDVPAEAALCFLRFLYSAKTDIPNHCLIHVCELARRFGVKSLLDTCELLVGMPHGSDDVSPAEEEQEEDDGGEREDNFLELLKSMWVDEDEDLFKDQEVAQELEEEEKVDDARVEEVDLDEIYEFAATQRRMPEEQVTEAESSSELDVGYQDKESEEQSPSNRSQVAGKQPIGIVNQESLDCHNKCILKNNSLTLSPVQKDVEGSPQTKSPCLHSNSLESSPVVSRLASPALRKSQPPPVHCVSPVLSPSRRHSSTTKSPARQLFITDSKPLEGPSAELSESSTAAVHTISLISPNREEDHNVDVFTHHSPAPLDDSYDRIFSETCGEYVEPSGLCKTSSRIYVDAPHHEPPILTSSPSVIQHCTLPELGSSPNVQPHTQSFFGQTSFAAPDNGNSTTSICVDPKYSGPTQNSSNVSSTAVSQEQDIILILSSDEETDGAQTEELKAKGNISGMFTNIKDSPASFSIRRNSEGHSLLDRSSSSEMSWLVPATPMAHLTGTGISILQTSHIPQSPKTTKTTNLDDSRNGLVSPTQRCTSSTPSVTLSTTKTTSIANQPPLPKTPEKIVGSRTSTGSKISCVRSSPVSSIASSTVFEVVDSEEEEAVAKPQADTSACSFQMDYDEPPIPVEDDLWLNAQQSPARTYSSPGCNASLHIIATPTKDPGTPCSTSALQERYSEPDNSEDSPQSKASQSKQSSYLNSKLWDEWEEEEPELPAVLPLSQRLNKVPDVQKLLRTPVSIVRKRELPPKVAITPLPDYSDMDTPVLKKELNRFGVRALPKKQMVLKLKEIFSYTHQVMSSDSEEDIPFSQPNHRNIIGAVQGQRLPESSKQRAPATSTSTSTSLTKPGKKTTTVCAAQEADSGDDQPPTASQESTTSSVAASDTSSISQSSNTNEFETAFADEEDDEPVPASQAANKEAATAEAVRNFIENRPDLHKRILLYEPLDLAALHAELKQNGIKIAAGKLLDFLDVHCVTFTTATARKEKTSRRRKKAGKRY